MERPRILLRDELRLSDRVDRVFASRALARAKLLESGEAALLVGGPFENGRDVRRLAREAPDPEQESKCYQGEYPGNDEADVADVRLKNPRDHPEHREREADEAQHLPVHLGLLDFVERCSDVPRGRGDLLLRLRHHRELPRAPRSGKSTTLEIVPNR